MTVTWKRNAGRMMLAGDSITVGYNNLAGGWRKHFLEDLTSSNISWSCVGPYTTGNSAIAGNPAHRGLSGDKAQDAAAGFGSEVATYDPQVIIYGWGTNDLGNGRTSAQFLTDLDSCIDAAQANGFALHLVQTVVKPQSNHAYYANIAAYNTAATDLPARVTAQGATLIDVGAPATTDGLHPDDVALGYTAMATAIITAILAAIA